MKKLLLIDDDVGLLEMLGKALSPHEYHIKGVTRIADALNAAKEDLPDYIMLDVMLPDGAGYEFSRRARSDPLLYKLPILFVSALRGEPEIEHALRQGGDLYLCKPFFLKQLLEQLNALELLSVQIAQHSPQTGLLSLQGMQREVDHRLFTDVPFDLCYITIDNLDAFTSSKGQGETDKVVLWMGEELRRVAHGLKLPEVRLAHLGRDHFLALLLPEHTKPYCRALNASFEQKIPQFYKDFEIQDGYIVASKHKGTFAGYHLMSLRIDVAQSEKGHFANASEIMSQLREVHKSSGGRQKALFRFDQEAKW